MSGLVLEGVRKGFGAGEARVEVLKGVDWTLEEGDFVVLTGPSGSGKTTLLAVAGLLLRPDAGRISFWDRDAAAMDERELAAVRAREVGMVFQKFCLLERRSALDNVLFRFRYAGGPTKEARLAAEAALERVGMADKAKRRAGVMSAGEMQRVAIARAIASHPRLLLADEPTGNLDEANAEGVMELFRDLNREGMTVMVVTHNPAWTQVPGARICRMERGRVVEG
ncbi:MAG: ABC transporter ATP-binding protein [Kiritimatiellae bacterium]|nr:ABC transporter ATP-binding protein [Kiritimatiellia bacterium]